LIRGNAFQVSFCEAVRVTRHFVTRLFRLKLRGNARETMMETLFLQPWPKLLRSGRQLVTLIAGLALALSVQAGLLGTSVTATLSSPNGVIGDPTPLLFSDTLSVGAGTEISAGNGTAIGGFMLPAEFIDLADSSIQVRVAAGSVLPNGALVTGYENPARYTFSALNPLGETITGISVTVGANEIANLAALSAANWIQLLNPHTISMELDPILFVDPGTGSSNAFADVTIALSFQPNQINQTPEPSTLLLFVLGILAASGHRHRGKPSRPS
jgi:hypothetical protein